MHWGASREGPLERLIQPQKGADTLQRAIISVLLDWSFISHPLARQHMVLSPLEVEHSFWSHKEGSRQKYGQLSSHPPINTDGRGKTSSDFPAQPHTVGLRETCSKTPSFPSLFFLSRYWEAVSHVTEGKCLTSEERYFKDEHALLRNPRGTCSALHWRVSWGLTAATLGSTASGTRGQQVGTAGVTERADLLSKAKHSPGASEDSGSGLPVPLHECIYALLCCLRERWRCWGTWCAESTTYPDDERDKIAWGLGGFLAACLSVSRQVPRLTLGVSFLLLSACKPPTQRHLLPILQSQGHGAVLIFDAVKSRRFAPAPSTQRALSAPKDSVCLPPGGPTVHPLYSTGPQAGSDHTLRTEEAEKRFSFSLSPFNKPTASYRAGL